MRILALLFMLLVPASLLAESRSEIELITLEAQPTIQRRVRAKPEAFAAAVGGAVMMLMASAGDSSLEIIGPPFARYTLRSATMIEADVGLPVRKAANTQTLSDGIRASELPAGRAAVLLFRGRHEHLPRAHAKLDGWFAANKMKPAGSRWEVYVTNPFETPDPDAQQTRILAPIQR